MIGKTELVNAIADAADVSKAKAATVYDKVIDLINATLINGDEVRAKGLGSFHVKQTQGRKGRNPATREPIDIPARKRVKFRAGKELREALGG